MMRFVIITILSSTSLFFAFVAFLDGADWRGAFFLLLTRYLWVEFIWPDPVYKAGMEDASEAQSKRKQV